MWDFIGGSCSINQPHLSSSVANPTLTGSPLAARLVSNPTRQLPA